MRRDFARVVYAVKFADLRQYRTITYFAIRRVVFFSPAKLPILGINALVLFAIGFTIAAKNRLFLPQNRLRFSLDDIVRYCLKKTGDYFAKNSPVFCKIDKTQLPVDKIPSVFGGVASEKLL